VLAWVAGLAVALYAAEHLVRHVTRLGSTWALSAGLVGFMVALGADGPEVTSAIVALGQGSTDVGLGVIVGSNIFNFAGLLGLAAVVAGRIRTGAYRLTLDGGVNALLTLIVLAAIAFRSLTLPLVALGVLVLLLYVLALGAGRSRVLHLLHREPGPESPRDEPDAVEPIESGSEARVVVLAALCVVAIIVGSVALVQASLTLGPELGVPPGIVGTFVLAIATSLPNAWATVSLARKGHAAAAISSTFNSNSINLAIGACLPSLFVSLHVSHTTRVLDVPWLLLMTAVSLILVATRLTLTRVEGSVLIAMYAAFVAIRLTFFA
jgi:cation:H+ antiporter